MRLFLLAIMGFSCMAANSQQYLIEHDLINFQTRYYRIENRDTIKVKNISLKKNSRILLRVENYNPYYWNARVTAFKTPVEEEAEHSFAFNPVGGLASGFTNLLGNLPLLDLPKSRGGNDGTPSGKFMAASSNYAQQYQKLQELNEKHDQLQVLELQLKELKHDFSKSESAIKKEAQEAVKKVLGTDNLEMMAAIEIGRNLNRQYSNALEGITAANSQIQQQLRAVDPDEDFDGTSFRQMAQKTSSSFAQVNRLVQLQEKNPNFMVDQVAQVARLYREIQSTNFSFSYSLNSEADLSDLKLELFPKESSERDTIVQYFQLNGKKNLKIRNSVGVAFTYFTANNTRYFVGGDSIIQKGGKDLFNPLVSTFIHFYSGNSSGLKWGGAFGIGIPLTGEQKDINFLLGLTTAFGQNEPILLSFGISGAKVNKLNNGYAVGDKVSPLVEDNLVSPGYDIGGFLSITFNLSGLSRK